MMFLAAFFLLFLIPHFLTASRNQSNFTPKKPLGPGDGQTFENGKEAALWKLYKDVMNNSLLPEAVRWSNHYRLYRAEKMAMPQVAARRQAGPASSLVWTHIHRSPRYFVAYKFDCR